MNRFDPFVALRLLSLRAAVSLALAAALGGCAASVTPADPDGAVRCVCCPTGDLSGRCVVGSTGVTLPVDASTRIAPRPLDGAAFDRDPREPPSDGGSAAPRPPMDGGSGTVLEPPPGTRWCTLRDLRPGQAISELCGG